MLSESRDGHYKSCVHEQEMKTATLVRELNLSSPVIVPGYEQHLRPNSRTNCLLIRSWQIVDQTLGQPLKTDRFTWLGFRSTRS